MHNESRPEAPLRVLVVGAGFAGLGLAIRLRQAGIDDYLVLEKAADVGGCWRENRYPGAACDVPSHLYSFSFEPKADWSRKFAPQAEILDYLRHCADKYRLREKIRFHCEVEEARFDAGSGEWQVRCADGQTLRARALVCATGQLSRPLLPRLPGLERFQGPAFHSANWDAEVELAGKRVAVIGTGASAIQFVPRIAPQVQRLSLFQRSAPYVIAKPDRTYADWERRLKARWPWLQRLDRGLKYLHHESRMLAFATFPALMKVMRLSFHRHLHRQIADPQLRARLVPDYPLGCKRILISNDYYPALARSNVELVDTGIREVTEDAVVGRDGRRHEVDAIIFGTGFAATEFLARCASSASTDATCGRPGRMARKPTRASASAASPTVHPLRAEHQPRPQLHRLHAGKPVPLRARLPAPAPGAGLALPRREARGPAALQPGGATGVAPYRLGAWLRQLVQDCRRQEHQQLAGLHLRLSLAYAPAGACRL